VLQCEKIKRTLKITVLKNNIPILQQTAKSAYKVCNLSKGLAHCFDVTENLVVTGHPDGSLYVFDASNPYETPSVMRTLKGHLADVYTTKFFPSKTVLISAGADIILKIWTLMEGGLCVAELKGHKRGVLSIDMIDRGRNLVSSSLDGTAILWDVPTQSKVHTWGEGLSPINHCHITSLNQGNEDKLVVLSCESGSILGYDVRQGSSVFSCQTISAVNSTVNLTGTTFLVSGEQNGTVKYWDQRKIDNPIRDFNLERSVVTKLLNSTENHSVWISTGNGATYNWDPSKDDNGLTTHLISDTESINGLCYRKPGDIITLSRKGIIKYYDVTDKE